MKKCFRSAKRIYALCLSKKSKILSLAYLKADDSTLLLNRDIHMYDKCMTKQKGNRVVDIYNAVSVRSEADSNRCTRFCRPLPSHSAIRPNRRSLILRNIPDREYLETPDTPANPPCRQLRTIRSVLRLQIYKHFSFLQNLSGNFRFSLKNPYLYVEFHPSFSCLDKARIRSALRPA